MKIAVIGSRNVIVKDLGSYLSDCDEIVSGGARGVDSCAAKYAKEKGIKLTEFLPQYDLYGRGAPIIRNKLIVDYADKVLAFWDGSSRGTLSVIKYSEKVGKPCEIIICEQSS
jgi:predicted Rossmann fold nucleotide-binding protein DprA/Smf involved in DNA uptake